MQPTMTAKATVAQLVAILLFLLAFTASTSKDDETCEAVNACAAGDVVLVESKVSRISEEIPSSLLHVSANGNHEGWLVRVPRQEDGSMLPCHIHMVKSLVAREIVAEYQYENVNAREVDLRGPHRLVDEEGKAFPQETRSNRLHLLLPREAFMHQAVEEGFARTLSDGTMTLTTLSLNPRVFLIDPILSETECEELIDISSLSLRKSPEKHYSDEYKNYRTSWTGGMPFHAPTAHKLWQRVKNITAMPDGGVESPQLLKYDTNTSWYKQHHDFYHNFESRPLEEVRMFVQTRAQELLRWKISPEISNVRDDEFWIEGFDPIQRTMSDTLAETLIQSLSLEEKEGVRPQRQLHDYLMQSDNPVHDFAHVALIYASELLRAYGASDPDSLTKKYFQLEGVETNSNVLPLYYLNDYVPYVLKPIQSNRHVTVLPILRAANRGGNTAFPRAVSNRMGVSPDQDEEFQECKTGLLVKADSGQALMFYNRLPRGDLDYSTIHAGCPPKEGEKFAVNCFTWDSDQDWAFKFLTEIDRLY